MPRFAKMPKGQTSLICLGYFLQIEKMRDVVAGAHLQGSGDPAQVARHIQGSHRDEKGLR